jgi:predicted phage terminase large subunit-like protein
MAKSALDQLLAFTDDEVAALGMDTWQRHVELATALTSPHEFATAHSKGTWLPYRHLVRTSQEIVGMVERDTCDCLVVPQPVRHGKTELCSRWTPSWFVIKHRQRVLLASYQDDFAASHGRRVREIVGEVGPAYGVHIDTSSRAAFRWELRGYEGGMNTAGAGGPIIGKGGNLLIVDDPQKQEDAYSALLRDRVWEWWQGTFLTRREPRAKVLLIMSRWHADDLIGRLHEVDGGMRVREVRFPALAEEDDPLGREPGEALCPERFDEVALRNRQLDVGSRVFSAQYQQRPLPESGGIFKRETFRYWRRARSGYQINEQLVDPEECTRFATMDLAFTRTKRADYTVIATWAVAPTKPLSSLLLLDLVRVRVESAEHARLILECKAKWSPAWVGVERQHAAYALLVEAQRAGAVVRELRPDKNKAARAEVAVALLEQGRIFFPKGAPWLDDFENELCEFDLGAHDDQVDVLAYAARELAMGTVRPFHRRRNPWPTVEERAARMIEQRTRPRNHPVFGRF